METYNCLSSIGIALDMIGVIVIFFFGITPRLNIEGQTYRVTGEKNENEIRLAKIYKRISLSGLIIVFIGFLLQFISNLIK
jgi:ketopantoate hydroxymethyltransferase